MEKNIEWFKKVSSQWSLFQPPVRPSKGEIEIWRQYMKPGKKVLILGATPELRDLAHSLKSKVVVTDMNSDMLVAMSDLMRCKDKIKEEAWVRGLWTGLPLKNNYFDYIIGDFVINNIPHEVKNKFFKKICKLLKPYGLFITRHLRRDGNFKISKVMEYYADQKDPNMSEFEYVMQWVSYNKRLRQMRLKDIRRDMKNFIKTRPLAERKRYQKLYDKFLEYWPFDKSWYLASPNNEERIIKKHFRIKNIRYAKDHKFAHLCPIYILKKK